MKIAVVVVVVVVVAVVATRNGHHPLHGKAPFASGENQTSLQEYSQRLGTELHQESRAVPKFIIDPLIECKYIKHLLLCIHTHSHFLRL